MLPGTHFPGSTFRDNFGGCQQVAGNQANDVGVSMRILLSVTILFALFILGCGGSPEMIEEAENVSGTEMTEEEEAEEMELQDENTDAQDSDDDEGEE